MRVLEDLEGHEPPPQGTVVTIGAYDGVHLGHQAVLRVVHDLARARGMESVCLTFDRHPAEVVRPGTAPKVLTTLEQKLELLAATGLVDTTSVMRFDEAASKQSAEDFVDSVVAHGLGARLVVVGVDFHFGLRRHGNVRLLEQMGAELGFEVLGLGLVPIDGDPAGAPYSSSMIRALLGQGRVAEAARLLGRPPRPYEVRGVVTVGDSRGHDLGFPTANVSVPEEVCVPGDAVYAGWLVAEDGVERATAISVGARPTFYEDGASLLEAHVLDFDGDLYGQQVKVRFDEHLRGQERFETVEALVAQIRADVQATRRIVGPSTAS